MYRYTHGVGNDLSVKGVWGSQAHHTGPASSENGEPMVPDKRQVRYDEASHIHIESSLVVAIWAYTPGQRYMCTRFEWIPDFFAVQKCLLFTHVCLGKRHPFVPLK